MNFLKPWRGITELESFSPVAQKRLWREFESDWFSGATQNLSWIGVVSVFAVGMVVWIIMEFVLKPLGLEGRIYKIGLVIVVGFLGFFILRVCVFKGLMRKWIRYQLHKDYAGYVFPFCVQCGYDLRGCKKDAVRCPECGNEEIRGNPAHAPDPKDIIKF